MTLTDPAVHADEVLSVLHRSHERLAGLLVEAGPGALTGPSYHSWTIAQVASHLGSGAEINGLRLAAALAGTAQPGPEESQPIWDRWNAMSPQDQAVAAVRADREFLAQVDELTPEQREGFELDLYGSRHDLASFLRTRLAEHVLHAWDIRVALDPGAQLADDAVPIMADHLDGTVAWAGKYQGEPVAVDVRLRDPARHFRLELSPDGSRLLAAGDDAAPAEAVLTMPAEAFVRLVTGRLDSDHTPSDVTAEGIDLDTLRRAFPGL